MVVIGILTGPSVIDCFGGPDNAGMCLRDKLAGAGLAPPAASAPVAEAEAGQTAAEAEAATPEVEAVPPEADQIDDLIAATFGLLRAEPDGSVVIAGSGTPGSEVEVYADEELIGRTTVEDSGDWVLVPEEPIAPGGREITLAEAGKEGRADQSFVVVIDPDRDSQPLVVASEPGEASEVLQGLERPAPMEVASVPEDATAAPETPEEPAQPPAAPTEASVGDTDPPADEPADAPVASDAPQVPASEAPSATADSQAPAAGAPQEPVSEPEPSPAPEPVETAAAALEVPADEPSADQTPAPVGPEPASEPAAPEAAVEPEAVAAVPAPATPTAEPPAAVPEPIETAAPPTIDAIEIDGDRTFFAGAGPDGATMRLYVDDVFIADAPVDGGRWLVEAGDILPGPQHAVRIDMLVANSAEVAARAEVNFRVDMPAQTTAVAEAPATETAETSAEPQPQAGTTAKPVPAPAETVAPEPRAEVAEAVDAGAVPTMVAEPVGDPELQRFASGRAIIRRGDNLWTIARRVYGQGIRYTTIYQANTAQIRDPDWIYPGQVFDLPKAEQ
ncbi:LysM peptidoglycan-binding domain-containing protein [Devosia nitrariae]|uniref:LysM domain-containing protein n=1 Tax=Devosia nitrariae TaxID=2071872 RepID=A0ABQ5W5K5_9HYPH|nr:LysM peptidoglycan-binding domain-containing protein [Devosia nitrariae]GLQ55162.1 hypothetical protein GCM10010862_24210 [Devosia nitrariae]